MTKIPWLLLLLALSTGAAAESAMPAYSPQGYCASLAARTGARSPAEADACLSTEQQQRAKAAALWTRASEAIRDRCQRRNTRASYDLLALCIEDEMERTR